jgi:hypothetical protein
MTGTTLRRHRTSSQVGRIAPSASAQHSRIAIVEASRKAKSGRRYLTSDGSVPAAAIHEPINPNAIALSLLPNGPSHRRVPPSRGPARPANSDATRRRTTTAVQPGPNGSTAILMPARATSARDHGTGQRRAGPERRPADHLVADARLPRMDPGRPRRPGGLAVSRDPEKALGS